MIRASVWLRLFSNLYELYLYFNFRSDGPPNADFELKLQGRIATAYLKRRRRMQKSIAFLVLSVRVICAWAAAVSPHATDTVHKRARFSRRLGMPNIDFQISLFFGFVSLHPGVKG